MLAISNNLPSSYIHVQSDLETVWAVVELGYQKVVLAVCYRPPTHSTTFVNELHDVTYSVRTQYPNLPIFLLGDFNFPNITWYADSPTIIPLTSLAKEFVDFCTTFSFTQVVKQPTRTTQTTANILDLVLTSTPDLISGISYLPGLSDHSLLSFHIDIPRPKAATSTKIIRNYKKANFEAINNQLGIFLETFLMNFDKRSVQENWDLFAAKVNELYKNSFLPTLFNLIKKRRGTTFI